MGLSLKPNGFGFEIQWVLETVWVGLGCEVKGK